MEDILLLDAVERYLSGAMLPEEKAYFEQLRKNTPEIDQMVVEHKLFLQQMGTYSEHRNLKHALHESHARLLERGDINEGGEVSAKGKVIQLFHRYKKVTAIAASIAGFTALTISVLVAALSPTVNKTQIQQLNGAINQLRKVQQAQGSKINELNSGAVLPKDVTVISSGTAFLIDGKGYLVTNAHVLKGSGAIVVNNKGQEFFAKIINIDQTRDLAILKIDDNTYKSFNSLPYAIKKSDVDLGEELYTLGYPRDEIVYNMGYLSAESGFNGDTSSYQLSLTANPGNSGGPIFNKNGEIVGVLSTRQTSAEGVVFAVKAKGIYKMIEELKKSDSSLAKIKMPSGGASLKGVERSKQIKEVADCVFLVKAYNQQ
ncbi:S1C family serine protease [Foetidibacter luteolus]|uniref:S1C family serine protease n=1 Tax=Foetidibacter luteolus TaxID=2608880 RepID=UPI001A99AE40|nr:serine protease [Foetidibacter luteolus]